MHAAPITSKSLHFGPPTAVIRCDIYSREVQTCNHVAHFPTLVSLQETQGYILSSQQSCTSPPPVNAVQVQSWTPSALGFRSLNTGKDSANSVTTLFSSQNRKTPRYANSSPIQLYHHDGVLTIKICLSVRT